MAVKKYTGFISVVAPLKPTELQTKLIGIIGTEKAMRAVHQLLGEFCEPYVPKNTGGLRAAMKAYPKSVKWETPSAHYQYMGIVYAPNYLIGKEGSKGIWRSPAGKKKKKTGRELGVPGEWNGIKFGYTTKGTSHHWLDKAMAGRGKNNYSIAVTRKLKELAGHN